MSGSSLLLLVFLAKPKTTALRAMVVMVFVGGGNHTFHNDIHGVVRLPTDDVTHDCSTDVQQSSVLNLMLMLWTAGQQ